METRSLKQWWGLVLRGMAMGAADLVPGVSGGTVAFIVGIYEELLTTIGGLGLGTVRDLFRVGPVATWRQYNLGFLAALGAGIFTAVALWPACCTICSPSIPCCSGPFLRLGRRQRAPHASGNPRSNRGTAAGVALLAGSGIAWWLTACRLSFRATPRSSSSFRAPSPSAR